MSENHNSPRVMVSNYTKIWNLDFVIYALEGKKLPVPANLRVILIFVVCWVTFWFLGTTVLFFVPKVYTNLLLPLGATWLIAKQKLDGKPPHKWLFGMVRFWISPKHLYRYKKFEHTKHYVYGSKVIFRTRRERA